MINNFFKNKAVVWLAQSRTARALLWTAVALLVWTRSQWAIQDALVFGAFIYALRHPARAAAAWKNPAGIAFAILLVHEIARIPFSTDPGLSFRAFVRMIEIYAGMFAITCVFNTSSKIKSALFYSAVAIALTLAFDLVRLYYHLGDQLFEKAHVFKPFILNHSNVASMMAGAACIVFFLFLWENRHSFLAALSCGAGMAISVFYKIVVASRGPQIAFALTCALVGFLMPGWRRKAAWLVFILAGTWLLVSFSGVINRRMLEEDSMKNLSERTVVWSHTVSLSNERPFFGYGFGRRLFRNIYYSTNPPESRFDFPHAHQFWLKILFEYGWTGLFLHAAAWILLAARLIVCIYRERNTFSERLLPGTIALLIAFVMIYGMGDFPDNIVKIMQYWLVPAALVATFRPATPLTDKKI